MSYTKIFIFSTKNDKKWYITRLYSANIMIYGFFHEFWLPEGVPPGGPEIPGKTHKS